MNKWYYIIPKTARERIKNYILPKFSEKELEEIKQIAKELKIHLSEDLKDEAL